MIARFFTSTVLIGVLLWYLHEFHAGPFMAVSRNIPFISPIMAKLHSLIGPASYKSGRGVDDVELLYTPSELSKYTGEPGSKGLYIALLGKVYDVEKGKKHYAPGGTYHIFTGKDSSRSFITGEFDERDASDDVLDLPLTDILSLKQWQEFYDKDYVYKGKLVGRYFSKTGEKTEYHEKLDRKLKEAQSEKSDKQAFKREFPPCNMEWTASSGSRVWCSPRSGGIQRDWVGVPRKLYEVGSDKHTCVCINLAILDDPASPQYSRRFHLEEYKGCDILSAECFYDSPR